MSIKRFNTGWDLGGSDTDKLAHELVELGECSPWTKILAALTHGAQTWTYNLVHCTLRYDKQEDVFVLALNNLVA
jgi:hypothetical protein